MTTNGTTALMTAATSGSVDAVAALLDHGAGINAKEGAHGQTALMFAAGENREAVIRLLLARGADWGSPPTSSSWSVRESTKMEIRCPPQLPAKRTIRPRRGRPGFGGPPEALPRPSWAG